MRRNNCNACSMMRNGVKTRKSLVHTCGLPIGAFPKDMKEEKLSFDEEAQEHEWKEGDKWTKEVGGYSTREDICTKCGCERLMSKFYLKGKEVISVGAYSRSKQVYGSEHMPECWGSKNPE